MKDYILIGFVSESYNIRVQFKDVTEKDSGEE